MKREITERVSHNTFIESELLDLSLKQAASYFLDLDKALSGKGYLKIIVKRDYDSFYLEGTRLETDGEYNARNKREAEKQERKEAKERAEYERLKSKYENNRKD